MDTDQVTSEPQVAPREQLQLVHNELVQSPGILRRVLNTLCGSIGRDRTRRGSVIQLPAPVEMSEQISAPEVLNQAVTAADGEPSLPEPVAETKEELRLYCCLCYEQFPQSELLNPCKTTLQCLWCGECLRRAFENASKSPDCMPAKCHTIIQLHFAAPFISEETARAYKDRFDVWSTRNHKYCPIPNCSAFIAPRLIDAATDKNSQSYGKLDCPACYVTLCIECCGVSHPGLLCQNTDVDPETLAALRRWGYKRCPKCKDAVRRMYGCNHIRCICGASWCWRCNLPVDECDQEICGDDEDEEDDQNEEDIVYLWQDMLEEGVELPTLFNEEYIRDRPFIADETPAPQSRLRRRGSNLDALPESFWQRPVFNFGREPTNNSADALWCCQHRFKSVDNNAPEDHEVGETNKLDKFHCHRCWQVSDITGVKECQGCWLMCCVGCAERCKPTQPQIQVNV